MALKYPGIRILVVRRTYPELINNHINILRTELLGIAKYNDKDKVLKFTNGSTINFTYCAKDGDLDRLQGVEYDVIFLDEATQLSEYQMKAITACIRGVNAFPKRCYYTANPGGQGHAYIKRLFIDRRYNDDENPDDYEFIQSLVTDNKALMQSQPEYIDQLKALPHKLREAWLYGKWDIFEGQFFEEFTDDPKHYGDHKWSHVIEPFEINGSYKIYRSFDWGYARPFSVGWYGVSSDDVIYRFLEWYGCTGEPNVGVKKDAHEVFKHIAEIERTHPWLKGQHIIGVADPAIWQEDGGESIAQTAEKYRVYFNKADNSRIPGWMQCHYRLRFDENGKAMFYVFRTCKDFIRTLPLMMYDEHDVEDLDTSLEDHQVDDFRYMMMSRPIVPRPAPPKDNYYNSPLYTALDIKKEDWL